MPIRCLIVDDSPVFLESARRLLESEGLGVVGTASTSAEAIALAAELEPDVVLVDVELGDESGFELVRRLAASSAATRMILISTYPEEDLVDLVASSPAAGFIAKSSLSVEAVKTMLT